MYSDLILAIERVLLCCKRAWFHLNLMEFGLIILMHTAQTKILTAYLQVKLF